MSLNITIIITEMKIVAHRPHRPHRLVILVVEVRHLGVALIQALTLVALQVMILVVQILVVEGLATSKENEMGYCNKHNSYSSDYTLAFRYTMEH